MGDADCPQRDYFSQGGKGGSLRRGQGAAAGRSREREGLEAKLGGGKGCGSFEEQ